MYGAHARRLHRAVGVKILGFDMSLNEAGCEEGVRAGPRDRVQTHDTSLKGVRPEVINAADHGTMSSLTSVLNYSVRTMLLSGVAFGALS